jgi:hypothetical protein
MSKFASILVAALVCADQPSSSSNLKDLKEERQARFLEAGENATQQTPEPKEIKEKAALKERLETAFGKECPELTRPIKFWIPAQGLLLTAHAFHVEDDGGIAFSAFSLAQFSKAGDGFDPTKIKVLRKDSVKIKLDRPVTSILDIQSREIREIAASAGHPSK